MSRYGKIDIKITDLKELIKLINHNNDEFYRRITLEEGRIDALTLKIDEMDKKQRDIK